MHSELYSDGIGEITVSGSIVRVDLVSLSPTERDADNKPKSVLRQRLIFPVEGFANSVEVMQKALQGLIDAGAIKRHQPRAVGSAADPAASEERSQAGAAGKPRANSSVNFS